MENNSLKHYGVLGMKWGMRKYQNPDGTLTAAGKKRYGENGKYEYKSHRTKRYEKKVSKYFEKAKSQDFKTDAKLENKAIKAAERLKASRIADKNYVEYAKKTSTGKAILQNVLFGSFGARAYQQARANGEGRAFAAALGILSNSHIGNAVARKTNADLAKTYAEGKTKQDYVRDKYKSASQKTQELRKKYDL